MALIAKIAYANVARIASALDAITDDIENEILLIHAVRIKNIALDQHVNYLHPCLDYGLKRDVFKLLKCVRDTAPSFFSKLSAIEKKLYQREQPVFVRKRDRLAQKKRALFVQWRCQATEIEFYEAYLTNLKQKLINGSECNLPLVQEENRAAHMQLNALRRQFAFTWKSLRAMNAVLLLKNEETAIDSLSKSYLKWLPSIEEAKEKFRNVRARKNELDIRLEMLISLGENEINNLEVSDFSSVDLYDISMDKQILQNEREVVQYGGT